LLSCSCDQLTTRGHWKIKERGRQIATLAAPVELGMMFWPAPLPPLQSFPDGPSTVFWVATHVHRWYESEEI